MHWFFLCTCFFTTKLTALEAAIKKKKKSDCGGLGSSKEFLV